MNTVTCTHCGITFTSKRSDARTCSPKCRMATSRALREVAKVNLDRQCNSIARADARKAARAVERAAKVAGWVLRERLGLNQTAAMRRGTA